MINNKSDEFIVMIPARFASTRLPGKPLLKIGHKTLIQHVCERANASRAKAVIVATDDQRILDHLDECEIQAVLTTADCQSGTDRIAQAADKLGLPDRTIVVNLQGDEPFMPAQIINQVAASLIEHPQARMSTACEPLTDNADFSNPDIVKVVSNAQNEALYFSRSLIPYPRESGPHAVYKHLGIYAYSTGYVKEFASLNPCELEVTEKLEQLRALWHGHKIVVTQVRQDTGIGVDTADDLELARKIYSEIEL